jgi:hypothetical protein
MFRTFKKKLHRFIHRRLTGKTPKKTKKELNKKKLNKMNTTYKWNENESIINE